MRWTLPATVVACLASVTAGAMAVTDTVTYVLDEVWLLPDISHPNEPARQMTGAFEWTYEDGDFENGTGQFTELFIPWDNPGIEELNITIELTSIEFSLIGKYHDRGDDLTLFLLDPLTLDQPSRIDPVRSIFEIQRGISRKGHVVSGRIVPVADVCPADLDLDGDVDFDDVLAILSAWGPCDACAEDLDENGDVGFGDLLIALSAWGPCQP